MKFQTCKPSAHYQLPLLSGCIGMCQYCYLNTNKVITDYEGRTPSTEKKIEACRKIIQAGYPMGFLIAPIFLYENWKADYRELLLALEAGLPENILHPLTFEVISHRYTTRAKNVIMEVFPDTTLPMQDEDRSYKYGQFGYGKYVYTKQDIAEIVAFFSNETDSIFNNKIIKYII